MLHKEQLKTIQDSILAYKKEPNDELFKQILTRLDDIIVGMVYKLSRKYYFKDPNIQDLYQCAILGLYKMVVATNEQHDSDWLLSRMYSYIRSEILQKYNIRKIVMDTPKDIDSSPVDAKLIQEEQLEYIASLIKKGIICEEDMQLLQLKFVEDLSIQRIVDTTDGKWGKTWVTVNKKIELTLDRIHNNMTERNQL